MVPFDPSPPAISLPVGLISTPAHARKTKAATVADIADSYAHNGQLQAIGVRQKSRPAGPEGGLTTDYELVFGGHRLEAARKVGWTHISARVYDLTDAQAESAMDAENLFRNPLKPAEFLLALKRWQELYSAEHANPPATEPAQGEDGSVPKLSKPAEKPKRFDVAAAEKLGASPQKVRRDVKAAKALSEDDLTIMAEKGVVARDIQAIAGVNNPEDRSKAVALVASGMDPKLALAVATSPPGATIDSVPLADAPGYKPESEMTDDEWLAAHCADALARLKLQTVYRRDALAWRHCHTPVAELNSKTRKILAPSKDYRPGPYAFRILALVRTEHPNSWLKCGPCDGTGFDKNGSTCGSCRGNAYTVRTGSH